MIKAGRLIIVIPDISEAQFLQYPAAGMIVRVMTGI